MERFFFNENMVFLSPDQFIESHNLMLETNIIVELGELEKLNSIPFIHRLIILGGDANIADFSYLYKHSEIKALMIDYYETESVSNWSIDVSYFDRLELLVSNSSYNFQNIQKAKSIKALLVKKWFENDLRCISRLPIESLIISNGLHSLDNYENNALRSLSISYSKCETIAQISTLRNLEILELDHCHKISDWNLLNSASLKALLALGYNHVSSISFIDNIPNLSSFVFEGSIDDGNVLWAKRLKRCFIMPWKRWYNCKRSEINTVNTEKTSICIDPSIDYFKNRNI